MTPSELIAELALRAADLVHAWAYADVHPQEIDEAIRRNEAA
jgi:hypothetical protein